VEGSESSFAQTDSPDGFFLEQQDHFIEIPTPDFDKTYAQIKNLIFDGFIPFRASFFGMPCVLKALTPTEFRFLEIIESDPLKRLPYYFLYSFAFIDGISVIPHRENLHESIVELWQRLPIPSANFIVEIIQSIQSAQSACYENLESYLYENESRYLWLVHGIDAVKNRLMRGYETIGLNTAQESWVAFNKREDLREEQERLFEHSKFIVSGMIGGKEIKKIENSERMRQTEEKKRRQDVRLKNKTVNSRMLSAPLNTVEDLVAELERQIRGEKDVHDRIIEQHEQKLRELREKRMREIELAVASRKMMDDDLSEGSRNVSPEEMQNIIAENQISLPNLDKADHYMDKINQTSGVSDYLEPKAQRIGDMKPKSIFDSEIQKELQSIKKSDG
jgi:hypothetical protein